MEIQLIHLHSSGRSVDLLKLWCWLRSWLSSSAGWMYWWFLDCAFKCSFSQTKRSLSSNCSPSHTNSFNQNSLPMYYLCSKFINFLLSRTYFPSSSSRWVVFSRAVFALCEQFCDDEWWFIYSMCCVVSLFSLSLISYFILIWMSVDGILFRSRFVENLFISPRCVYSLCDFVMFCLLMDYFCLVWFYGCWLMEFRLNS